MNFKLQSNRALIVSLSLLISLATTGKGAVASEDYLAQRSAQNPFDRYPQDRYPQDRYPDDFHGNDLYRYNGRGKFYDGERDYRCDTVIVDFGAPRARIKCDNFQITFQKGQNRDRNRMDFNVLQVDDARRYSDRYDGEISCEMNGESRGRLNRFSCEGVYRDRDNRSRRFQTNFEAYSPGKPLQGY